MVAKVTRFYKLLSALGVSALLFACSTAGLVTAPPSPPVPEEDAEVPVDPGDGAVVLPDGAVVPKLELTFVNELTVQVMPSDRGAAILDAIRTAKTSVHVEMYLLTNDDVIAALGALQQLAAAPI